MKSTLRTFSSKKKTQQQINQENYLEKQRVNNARKDAADNMRRIQQSAAIEATLHEDIQALNDARADYGESSKAIDDELHMLLAGMSGDSNMADMASLLEDSLAPVDLDVEVRRSSASAPRVEIDEKPRVPSTLSSNGNQGGDKTTPPSSRPASLSTGHNALDRLIQEKEAQKAKDTQKANEALYEQQRVKEQEEQALADRRAAEEERNQARLELKKLEEERQRKEEERQRQSELRRQQEAEERERKRIADNEARELKRRQEQEQREREQEMRDRERKEREEQRRLDDLEKRQKEEKIIQDRLLQEKEEELKRKELLLRQEQDRLLQEQKAFELKQKEEELAEKERALEEKARALALKKQEHEQQQQQQQTRPPVRPVPTPVTRPKPTMAPRPKPAMAPRPKPAMAPRPNPKPAVNPKPSYASSPVTVNRAPTHTSAAPMRSTPSATSCKQFPYKEYLTQKASLIEQGYDMSCQENYILDADFMSLFDMSRADFAKLPAWKRNQKKKDKDLF